MADPLWLYDVLKAEPGLENKVRAYPGWKDRGHGDFGTIWGIVAHHTGGNDSTAASIAEGRPDLPGPVSQIHIDRKGIVTVVAAGIAWHAGIGSWPGIETNNANQVTIGIEANSDGTTPWPKDEYDSYIRVCAAILRKLNVPASHLIGHKEWAGAEQGKWDPGGLDMNDMRKDVQTIIDRKEPPHMGDNLIRSLVDGKKYTDAQYTQFIDLHTFQAAMMLERIAAKVGADLRGIPGVRSDM